MENTKTNKPKLLYVDDERANLTSFRYLFKSNYEIFLAESADEGYKIMAENEIPVVISDLRMPGTCGIEFFEKISSENPEQIRILLTAFAEPEAIIQAVNKGHIHRYIKKPFDPMELDLELNKAMEIYCLKKENKELLEYLKSSNEKLILASQKLEQELKEKEQQDKKLRRQASLLDKARDAIMVIDLNNNISYWNESASRIYDLSKEEVTGREISEVISLANPEVLRNAKMCTLHRGEWSGELTHINKYGEKSIVESRWNFIKEFSDKSESILIIGTDITERKKLEKQFFHSQRIESIGILAGGIAHEINNILTPILVSARFIQNKLTDKTSKMMVDIIRDSVLRGSEIVKQILIFSRVEEGELTEINLINMINELNNVIKRTFPKNIRIELKIPKTIWKIKGNETQLQQVLLNICLNARDAMINGGTITFEALNSVIDNNFSLRNSINAGKYVEIIISDTGTGIPENIIDKIFNPFFTTKEPGQGTGLGLSTSLSIIKKHNGLINVFSIPGKGTSFKIHLPVSSSLTLAEPGKSYSDIPKGEGELIQLIDDEKKILFTVREILEGYGYSVITSPDGSDAVQDYRENKDKIKVVIIDINMPVMNGNIALSEFHKINPDLPVIISTGLFVDSKETYVNNIIYLSKPYTAEKLLETIAQALKKY